MAPRAAETHYGRLVTENRDAFVSVGLCADLGKPAAETVLMELNLVAGEAQFVRKSSEPLDRPGIPKRCIGCCSRLPEWTIAEPKGVVLIISPWKLSGAAGLGTNG